MGGMRSELTGKGHNMTVPYSPLAVANEFLAAFGAHGGIAHMKLQKLVYFAHGFWLGAYFGERPSLVSERPAVWKHGPVFDSLYKVLKVFGSGPITAPQSLNPFSPPPRVDLDDTEVLNLIHWIWGRYGHLSGFALSDLTHRAGTSWSRVATEYNYSVPFNLEIPDDYIRDEFQELLDGEEAKIGAQADGNGSRAAEARAG